MQTRRDVQFQDRVLWITGASSGIGEALAGAFHKAGAKLILSARREQELRRVKAACGNGPDVAVLPFDLERIDEIQDRGRDALEQFGRIDVLVNNAGISQHAFASETSLDVVERIMRVDYLAQIAVTKAVLPSMMQRGRGHIIVTSSVAGLTGVPMYSAYCGAKHALRGFFSALRGEVRHSGVQVTLVYPATVKTDISLNALRGDGSKYGIMTPRHQNGMSPDACAGKILEGIAVGREEIFVGLRDSDAKVQRI